MIRDHKWAFVVSPRMRIIIIMWELLKDLRRNEWVNDGEKTIPSNQGTTITTTENVLSPAPQILNIYPLWNKDAVIG